MSEFRNRQDSLKGLLRTFCVVVGLPTLIASLYYGLIASDQYIAEARFAVMSTDQAPAAGMLNYLLGSQGVVGAAQDAIVVIEYIHSRELLERLDTRLSMRKHYANEEWDWFSRLDAEASCL